VSYLLDTNVVSEWVKPNPAPGVIEWLGGIDEDELFISVVTLAEIRDGVERMLAGAKRIRLDEWLTGMLPDRFEGRTLAIDSETAIACGHVMARIRRLGRVVDVLDAFIAATALRHNLALVTRNTADFGNLELALINPWSPTNA
jgi:predicted nucleic acid-binding protein